jgi:DNA-binding MarR family transcriptional regulator
MSSVTKRRTRTLRQPEDNTSALLGQAWGVLGRRILDGVQAAGHPIRMAHSMVFVHMELEGIRLTELAGRAAMTPQAMGELVDDLERMGYVERIRDPSDGRAKLIVLTDKGFDNLQAAFDTIAGIEADLAKLLGRRRLTELRASLRTIIAEDEQNV